ncbi:HAD family hydrolase [Microbacterium sp. YY-01]|uniref:HAD family hydrolase n=1 Tax=Microbacterium sp. YY-01 TaxID=3421634 RepID=UPI003D162A86
MTLQAASGTTTQTALELVALDIDGTMILADETPSPGVADVLAEYRAAGAEVMLATGRSWVATQWVVEEFSLDPEFVVCSNGAVTLRRNGDGYDRWHVETFDPTTVLGLLGDRLPDARYMVELASGQRLFTEALDDWTLDRGQKVSFDQLSRQPVSRVVAVAPGYDEDDFHQIVEEAGLNEVSYAIGWTAWLDIAPKGVDKGTALERVCAERGTDRNRVFVAGDGRNDIGMFEWALRGGGTAVAMGQAPAEVKQAAAGTVTDTVEEGGLARALRAHLESNN